jgi:hypothetical protein
MGRAAVRQRPNHRGTDHECQKCMSKRAVAWSLRTRNSATICVGPTRVCTTDARETEVPNLTCPTEPAPKPLFPNPSRSS